MGCGYFFVVLHLGYKVPGGTNLLQRLAIIIGGQPSSGYFQRRGCVFPLQTDLFMDSLLSNRPAETAGRSLPLTTINWTQVAFMFLAALTASLIMLPILLFLLKKQQPKVSLPAQAPLPVAAFAEPVVYRPVVKPAPEQPVQTFRAPQGEDIPYTEVTAPAPAPETLN